MIKRHVKTCLILLALLVAVWLDRVYPVADDPILRAEPFSLTAFFVSLAFSAASYAIQRIFGPKPPKVTRGQMSGELYIQNADEGTPVAEIYGGAPGGATTTQATRQIEWTNLVNAAVNPDGSLEQISGPDFCAEDEFGPGAAGAWSVEQIQPGDWEVTWTFNSSPSGRIYLGVTDGSFTLSPNLWDFTMHVSTENNTVDPHPPDSVFAYTFNPTMPPNKRAFRNGVWQTGDMLRLRCVSGIVTWWWKDELLYTAENILPQYPMRVIASIACLNKTVDFATITQDRTSAITGPGGVKTAGTVIWCKEPRKVITKEKKGGKGAPKQTVETITYFTDLAILLGRGRLRLKKLWANSDLILDLEAPVGQATGLLGTGTATSGTVYSTGSPPSPTSSGTPTTWTGRIAADPNGVLSGSTGAGGASMRYYEGNFEQLPDALIEADVGAGNAPAYRGSAYLVIENFNISKYGGVPTFMALIENVDFRDLDEIADHLCERVGIEPGDRDFSEFDGQGVRGLIVQDTQEPRKTLELAAIPYNAQFYETVDGLLTGQFFGGASVVTIDPDELGMVEGDQTSAGEMPNKLEFGIVVDDQLQRQINVSAFNPFNNWEITTQSAYRMTGFARSVENLALPMTLTPDEARQAAERALYQRHVERESSAMRLPWKYCWVNPTDVVTVQSAGLDHKLRFGQIAGAVPGLLEVQAAADESAVYSQTISNTQSLGATWECNTKFTISGNSITMNSASSGAAVAYAQSENVINNPGEFFSWQMPHDDAQLIVGLTPVDCPVCTGSPTCVFDTGDINDFFFVSYSWESAVFNSGSDNHTQAANIAYTTNSVFMMRLTADGFVEFLLDGQRLWKSTIPAPANLRLAAIGQRQSNENDQPGVVDARVGFSAAVAPAPTIPSPAESIALLVDTTTLRDTDDAPGYYAAIAPRSDGAWSGAALYRDRGAGYEQIETFQAPAVAGVTTAGVTPTNVTTFDEVTTVTVDLYGTSAALESATELEVLNGANPAILGDSMIFQFRTATQVAGFDNRWTLSGLLWGRRGSDFAVGTIAAGSRFLLLDGAIRFIDNELSERNIARDFKAVTAGFAIEDVAATSFTWNARTLMPLSVVDIQGARDGSSNLTITFKRRTRIGGHWADGQDVPISEFSLSFELDIMDGSTVKRTISASVETAAYSAADQTTDFGSPQSSVSIRIYQISNTVGRGFVRTATI